MSSSYETKLTSSQIDSISHVKGTERTVFISWNPPDKMIYKYTTKNNKTTKTSDKVIDSWSVRWYYKSTSKVFDGGTSSVEEWSDKISVKRTCTYDIPDEAVQVGVQIKPVAKSKDSSSGSSSSEYYTGQWSNIIWASVYNLLPKEYKPETMDPSLTMETEYDADKKQNECNAVCTVSTSDENVDSIEFVLYKNDKKYRTYTKSPVNYDKDNTYTFYNLPNGHAYKLRVRGYNKKTDQYGDWSSYTEEAYSLPGRISNFTYNLESSTSVYLDWEEKVSATSYTIQYADDGIDGKTYDPDQLEINPQSVTISGTRTSSNYPATHTTITGLSPETKYCFRIKATNTLGDSLWCLNDDLSTYIKVNTGLIPSKPEAPSSPTVEVVGTYMTATLDIDYSDDANDKLYDAIAFQLCDYNGNSIDRKVFIVDKKDSRYGRIEYSYYLSIGIKYRLRCRAYNYGYGQTITSTYYSDSDDRKIPGLSLSDWSEWTDIFYTVPAAVDYPSASCNAYDDERVKINWSSVSNAKSYIIEYVKDDPSLYPYSKSDISSETIEAENEGEDAPTTAIINIGDDALGHVWYFWIRAVNDKGTGAAWAEDIYLSQIFCTIPTAPTTWSEKSKYCISKSSDIYLYFNHNDEDKSDLTCAKFKIIFKDTYGTSYTENIELGADDDKLGHEDDTTTYWYLLNNSSKYNELIDESSGYFTATWSVSTKGVNGKSSSSGKNIYGDFSVQRKIEFYETPTISVTTTDLTSYSFTADVALKTNSHKILECCLEILSNASYTTLGSDGGIKRVSKGESIFSKYLTSTDKKNASLEISPSIVNLENEQTYSIRATVSTDTGFTVTGQVNKTIAYEYSDIIVDVGADVTITSESVEAHILPYYVIDPEYLENNSAPTVIMSVYRIEANGDLTLLKDGISTTTTIIDKHPNLDVARYRIIALSNDTGDLAYSDIIGAELHNYNVIIQWDQESSDFTFDDGMLITDYDEIESASIVKLPYNIDVQEDHDPDVSLVKYIGRKHPVGYYGTHRGETANWKVDVPKSDKDTIYKLRRLASYMGNCYIREPSGLGYWAQVKVSMSFTHNDPKVPVTLSITRVEGDE